MPSQNDSKVDEPTWARKLRTNPKRVAAGAGVSALGGAVATLLVWFLHDIKGMDIHLEVAAAFTTVIIVTGNATVSVFGNWIAPLLEAGQKRLVKRIEGLNGKKK